jgi:orotate phosphoribosyltransferase
MTDRFEHPTPTGSVPEWLRTNDPFAVHIAEELLRIGAIRHGHFRLASGGCGEEYFNAKELFEEKNRALFVEICDRFAHQFVGLDITAVVGPATGGSRLAIGIASSLSKLEGRTVLPITAFKRSYQCPERPMPRFFFADADKQHIQGQKILLTEDVITTGASAREVAELVRKLGGMLRGAAIIVDRTGFSPIKLAQYFDTVVHALVPVKAKMYLSVEECPLCREGVPHSTELGHGGQK